MGGREEEGEDDSERPDTFEETFVRGTEGDSDSFEKTCWRTGSEVVGVTLWWAAGDSELFKTPSELILADRSEPCLGLGFGGGGFLELIRSSDEEDRAFGERSRCAGRPGEWSRGGMSTRTVLSSSSVV